MPDTFLYSQYLQNIKNTTKKLTVPIRYAMLFITYNLSIYWRPFMKRINKLLSHPDFTKNLNHLAILEKDRIYCRHDLSHLLDVARIACLLQYKKAETNLKSTILFSDEIIYAAALLHDLGRVLQYEQGLPHETAGLVLAKKILIDCDFTKSEQVLILDAIQFHRKNPNLFSDDIEDKEKEEILSLRSLLYHADKLSRNCFACKASHSCYWSESEKNKGITY